MRVLMRLGAALGVSALLLYLAFRNVHFDAMWLAVRHADHRFTALFVLALVFIQLCRIYRFDLLIRPFARISTASLFRISNVGLMLILLLPLRLGELARPYMLKQESGAPLSSGLGAVVVERVIDGLLVTLLFFVTTLGLGSRYHVPRALWLAALGALGIFVASLVVVVGTLIAHDRMFRLIRRWGARFSEAFTLRVLGMLDAFVGGLRSLPDGRTVVMFISWTLAYWAANGLGLYAIMRSFGWDLPVVAGFTLVCVLVIGIMIPAGPGNLGTFQGALLAGLAIFGIGPTDAAAYGMVVYPVTLVVQLAFGLPYLVGGRMRMREIVGVSAKEPAASALPGR